MKELQRGIEYLSSEVKTMKCELYNDSMQNWKKYPIKDEFLG